MGNCDEVSSPAQRLEVLQKKKGEATLHSGPTMADVQKSSTDARAIFTKSSHNTSGVSYHIKLDSTGNVEGDRTLSEKCLKLISRCNVGSSRTALQRASINGTDQCWSAEGWNTVVLPTRCALSAIFCHSPNNTAHSCNFFETLRTRKFPSDRISSVEGK